MLRRQPSSFELSTQCAREVSPDFVSKFAETMNLQKPKVLVKYCLQNNQSPNEPNEVKQATKGSFNPKFMPSDTGVEQWAKAIAKRIFLINNEKPNLLPPAHCIFMPKKYIRSRFFLPAPDEKLSLFSTDSSEEPPSPKESSPPKTLKSGSELRKSKKLFVALSTSIQVSKNNTLEGLLIKMGASKIKTDKHSRPHDNLSIERITNEKRNSVDSPTIPLPKTGSNVKSEPKKVKGKSRLDECSTGIFEKDHSTFVPNDSLSNTKSTLPISLTEKQHYSDVLTNRNKLLFNSKDLSPVARTLTGICLQDIMARQSPQHSAKLPIPVKSPLTVKPRYGSPAKELIKIVDPGDTLLERRVSKCHSTQKVNRVASPPVRKTRQLLADLCMIKDKNTHNSMCEELVSQVQLPKTDGRPEVANYVEQNYSAFISTFKLSVKEKIVATTPVVGGSAKLEDRKPVIRFASPPARRTLDSAKQTLISVATKTTRFQTIF